MDWEVEVYGNDCGHLLSLSFHGSVLCTWRIGLEGRRIVLGIRISRLVLTEKHDRQDLQCRSLSQSCIHAELSWESPAKSWSLSHALLCSISLIIFFCSFAFDPPNFPINANSLGLNLTSRAQSDKLNFRA